MAITMPSAAELSDIISDLKDKNTFMMEQIVALQNKEKAHARPRRTLDNPKELTGQKNYPTWLPFAEAVVKHDSEALGGPGSMGPLFFLYSVCHTDIQKILLPVITLAMSSGNYDTAPVFKILARVLANPTKQKSSSGQFLSIKQGENETVANYLSEFERLLFESGSSVEDKEKIAILTNGCNAKLTPKLAVQLSLPEKYEEFCLSMHRLGGSSGNYSSHHHNNNGGDPMDLSQFNNRDRGRAYEQRDNRDRSRSSYDRSRNRSRSRSRSPYDHHDRTNPPAVLHKLGQMSLAASAGVLQIAPSSTPSQRDHWQKIGACRRCGSFDHFASDCPCEPAIDSTRESTRGRSISPFAHSTRVSTPTRYPSKRDFTSKEAYEKEERRENNFNRLMLREWDAVHHERGEKD